mmetsp:Transcript_33167/g.67837  ORF Transcript_33167/g.67837 Transcript_33167/m.67837 type:complete len:259 (+) Transcript_33167:468-1244(+)
MALKAQLEQALLSLGILPWRRRHHRPHQLKNYCSPSLLQQHRLCRRGVRSCQHQWRCFFQRRPNGRAGLWRGRPASAPAPATHQRRRRGSPTPVSCWRASGSSLGEPRSLHSTPASARPASAPTLPPPAPTTRAATSALAPWRQPAWLPPQLRGPPPQRASAPPLQAARKPAPQSLARYAAARHLTGAARQAAPCGCGLRLSLPAPWQPPSLWPRRRELRASALAPSSPQPPDSRPAENAPPLPTRSQSLAGRPPAAP